MTLLIAIDELENTWFPRMHAIIRRVVDVAHRDELESAFFRDVDQQPVGPEQGLSVRDVAAKLDSGCARAPRTRLSELSEKYASRTLSEKHRSWRIGGCPKAQPEVSENRTVSEQVSTPMLSRRPLLSPPDTRDAEGHPFPPAPHHCHRTG